MSAENELETPLDRAHAAMEADLGDDAARLGFYERLADGELYLLLKSEASGDRLDADIFELQPDGDLPPDRYALVFDREDRLAAFAEGPAPYAALPGRVVAAMLAGQEIGLGVNLGVAPSSILIPPAAVDWLAETLGPEPEVVEGQLTAVEAPEGLSERLLSGFATKLAPAAGLCDKALLARGQYDDGSSGLILAFIDAAPDAQAPLARAAQEAITFSGYEERLDVAFFTGDEPVADRLMRVSLSFDMTRPEIVEEPVTPKAPGSDPTKPPILR
ncbi:SseB family protein [Maritimibacter sp. DP1N21-5]|uniref:SseB family protein n=1 Tax=Maritimibacter sp. DP1N21-5 TaxID=2836867 RepID=UPI001C46F0C2|nr:SseB family protein [Maritimibacter sp. DP1N21-5]MBV7409182.1 SseB family protein [Maritimibacter sp. DP1N21-5]